MPPNPQPPTVSIKGNALPLTALIGALVVAFIAWGDRATQIERIENRFVKIEKDQDAAATAIATAITARQRELDNAFARSDATARQMATDIDALRLQQTGLDRNAAVTAERLAAIAASIEAIQRMLQDRPPQPRRVSLDPMEAEASRRVALRDGGATQVRRGVPVAVMTR